MRYWLLCLVLAMGCAGVRSDTDMMDGRRVVNFNVYPTMAAWERSWWFRASEDQGRPAPVFVLITETNYACLVPGATFARVSLNSWFVCPGKWRAPRYRQ